MQLRYGTYVHRVSSCDLKITRQGIQNRSQTPIAVVERWAWTCKIYNKTGAATGMEPLLKELEYAYAKNGQDLVLQYTDGTPSYHSLRNRDCIGGTRVVQQPQFERGQGGEYVSYRTVSIAVEGVRPIINGAPLFIDFTERISISGGGARFGCKEVNRGPGVRQRLRTHSICRATQSGTATLYIGNPPIPPPIWPYALVDEYPDLDLSGPDTISAGSIHSAAYINKTQAWTYHFEFPYRLLGIPHYLLR